MDNSKRCGFTLGEVLLALAIVGVIGLLVIPGTVRGINNKAKVSLLKNTVANLGSAIKTELIKNRTSDITLTDIYNDPKTFLEAMDLSSKASTPFAESYKNYSGSVVTVSIPSNVMPRQGAVRLKSGVSVGIMNDSIDNTTSLIVDLTGPDKPNIVGADFFVMNIARKSGNGYNEGDIIFYAPNCKTKYAKSCKNGDGASCFALVVRSSYDEDYLNKDISCDNNAL